MKIEEAKKKKKKKAFIPGNDSDSQAKKIGGEVGYLITARTKISYPKLIF